MKTLRILLPSVATQSSNKPSPVILVLFAVAFVAIMAGLVVYGFYIQNKFNREFFKDERKEKHQLNFPDESESDDICDEEDDE